MPFLPVTWTDLENIWLVGNDLTKDADPVTDGWNAGAASVESIPSSLEGNGISFRMTARWLECGGMSTSPSNPNRDSIEFGVSLYAYGGPGDAWVKAIESGVYRGTPLLFTVSTVFKITINASGEIEYYADDVKFYTSLIGPTYPLYADASLYDTSAYGERSRIYDMLINAGAPPVVAVPQHLMMMGIG